MGGIYHKVNSDINFRADEADTVGGWRCQDLNKSVTYPVGTNPADVLPDLRNRGLVFTAFSYSCWSVHGSGGYGEGVVWTQSEPATSGKPWDLRAAVEASNTTNLQADQTYEVYECIMNAPSISGILGQTRPDTMINSWCNELKEIIIPPQPWVEPEKSDPALGMEEVLDVIATMGGSAWDLKEAPPMAPTQGCLAPRARVPWPVILLFLLAATTASAMGVYWLILLRAKSVAVKSMPTPISAIDELTPGDLLTWMQQAVREPARVNDAKVENLKR